jgi:hypothetical protein
MPISSSRGHGGDVLVYRQVREQPGLLDHVADLLAQLGRLVVEDAATAEQDVAAAERDHAVDQPHRGRLARPRRPDQHAHFPRLDAQAETGDRRLTLTRILLADVAQLERRRLRECRRPLFLGGVITEQGENRTGFPG